MSTKRAVGIDLGTTYSVASWIDGTGRTAVITNSEGDLLTPSVVTFGDDGIYVGKEAKKLAALKADRIAECVKRDMGSPYYSKTIDGMVLPPEVIQGTILKKLGQDIAARIGPDIAVVITVPAFFDEPRRRATAIAGEIAGLHVLDIINEPVAAALAFGEHAGILRAGSADTEPLRVLVYDLGGGTFDATLLDISQIGFRTLATDGDVHLGGRDWDQRLADLACEQFKKQFREDPRDNPISVQRLAVEIEHAKHTLSARQRARVRIDHAGTSLDTEITRDAFEESTVDLLERTAHTTRDLLAVKDLQWTDVSKILLAGGSTRMPMVARMLEEQTGITPVAAVSPDEAVARGAAIYAKYLLEQASDAPPRFQITNVNSHNLGIQGVERDTGEKVNAVLIPRNTPLPAKATRTFTTRQTGQRNVAVLVLEGESSIPSECTVIGRSVVNDLPSNLPAGYPIEVTYEYATNGRLHVHAQVPETGRQLDIEIERGARLPDEWISAWRQVVSTDSCWSKYKTLLAKQVSRERTPWRQLAFGKPTGAQPSDGKVCVEYDQVVLASNATSENGPALLEKTALELDRTVEAVWRDGSVDASTAGPKPTYGSIDSVYALHVEGRACHKRRRVSTLVNLIMHLFIAPLSGALAAQLVLWWGFHQDPFYVGPRVPRSVNWIVPPRFRQAAPVGPINNPGTAQEVVVVPKGKSDDQFEALKDSQPDFFADDPRGDAREELQDNVDRTLEALKRTRSFNTGSSQRAAAPFTINQ